jgi:SAM-dependent methyltransferase
VNTGDFFDRQHDTELAPLPLHYRLLRRFEVTRADTADRLIGSGRCVLDVGCGSGELSRRLAARFSEVCATDVSAAVIAAARSTPAPPNVRFEALDSNARFPFADGAFDTVVALSTLQYIFDPEAFLAEAHRVLSKNGRLLVEVPNMAYLPQRLRLLAGRPIRTSYWTKGIDGGNLHYFTVDSLRRLMSAAGFAIEVVTGSGVFAPLRTWRVSLLCGNIFIRGRRV